VTLDKVDAFIDGTVEAGDDLEDYFAPARLGTPLSPSQRPQNPLPVILLPGWGGSEAELTQWTNSLKGDGFSSVYFFHDPQFALGDIPTAAHLLAQQIEAVKKETGAPQVELVGFSTGGLVARAYLQLLHGSKNVSAAVLLSVANQGSLDSSVLNAISQIPLIGKSFPIPVSELQEQSGSAFMKELAKGQWGETRVTNIAAGLDPIVALESTKLPGATNFVVWDTPSIPIHIWPDINFSVRVVDNHLILLHFSNKVYELAREALLKGEPPAS
jgi:triacylglycerol esterase/lipase EstA (alpha/beta hydrolase family)